MISFTILLLTLVFTFGVALAIGRGALGLLFWSMGLRSDSAVQSGRPKLRLVA